MWPQHPEVLDSHPKELDSEAPVARATGFFFGELELEKRRVACFVDGFNLYHALAELDVNPKTKRRLHQKNHLKWLDIKAMVNAFITPSKEEVTAVYYFSAFATWLPDPYQRHLKYVKALESSGVTVIMGHFKKKRHNCKSCSATWDGHEEKESDVNFGIHLVDQAHKNSFDKALILTADTDLVPAIKLARVTFPGKEIEAVIPELRFQNALELRTVCSNAKRIKEHHIERNLFPEKILAADGSVVVTRPSSYQPPAKKAQR